MKADSTSHLLRQPVRFELFLFIYLLCALVLQKINIYKTNYHLVDFNLIIFTIVILGRRLAWCTIHELQSHWTKPKTTPASPGRASTVGSKSRSGKSGVGKTKINLDWKLIIVLLKWFLVGCTLLAMARSVVVLIQYTSVFNLLFLFYPLLLYLSLFGFTLEPRNYRSRFQPPRTFLQHINFLDPNRLCNYILTHKAIGGPHSYISKILTPAQQLQMSNLSNLSAFHHSSNRHGVPDIGGGRSSSHHTSPNYSSSAHYGSRHSSSGAATNIGSSNSSHNGQSNVSHRNRTAHKQRGETNHGFDSHHNYKHSSSRESHSHNAVHGGGGGGRNVHQASSVSKPRKNSTSTSSSSRQELEEDPILEEFIVFQSVPYLDSSTSDGNSNGRYRMENNLMLPTNPDEVRAEVDILLSDLIVRLKQLLFNSLLCAYYVGFIPMQFADSNLYYDKWWCVEHAFLVWANSFVILSSHLLPPSYCQLLYQCCLHLGCWTRCTHDENASLWSPDTIWPLDATVQWKGESFKGEGPQNVAIPCDSSQECFYLLFHSRLHVHTWLLTMQCITVAFQIVILLRSVFWFQTLSMSIFLVFNYFVLYKLLYNRLWCRRSNRLSD